MSKSPIEELRLKSFKRNIGGYNATLVDLSTAEEIVGKLQAENERRVKEEGEVTRQIAHEFESIDKETDLELSERANRIADLECQLEQAREALKAYADGDECNCADGSPDQPLGTKQCAYCMAQNALAALTPVEEKQDD